MRRSLVVFLFVVISACGGSEGTGTSTTSPPPTPAPTVAATTSTTALTTTTTEPTTTTSRGFGSAAFAAPFTFDGPSIGLELESRAGDQAVMFTSGDNRWVIFSTVGPRTIDEWSAFLSKKGTVTEQEAAMVGGVAAQSIDASANGSIALYSPEGIQALEFWAEAGDQLRLFVLEVEGVTVKVFVLASAEDFDGWLAGVEPVLEALVWG